MEDKNVKTTLEHYQKWKFKTIEKIPLSELEEAMHQYYFTHKPLKPVVYIIFGVMVMGFLVNLIIGKVTTIVIVIVFALLAIALFFTIKYMVRFNNLIKNLKALAKKYHIKLEVFSEEYNQMAMFIYGGRGVGKIK